MAAPPAPSLPSSESGTPTGQTTYQQGGLVCNSDLIDFTKPDELDSPNLDSDGSFDAEWGTLSWDADTRTVTWNIEDGWDVDVCVKGGTYLTTIDTSEFDGTSYVHTYAGLSHAGFFATELSGEPAMIVDCVEISYETGRPLNGADHINVDVVYNGNRGQINLEINENQAQDPTSTSGFHALLKFAAAFGLADVKVPISQEELDSGLLIFEYGQYFTGVWTIEWVQFNSTYFNQDRNELNFVTCGDLPTDELVVPTASMLQLTCDADGSYTLGDVEGVVWFVSIDSGPYAETVQGTYPVTAAQTVDVRAETSSDDYGFAAETQTEWTFGFLEPTDCEPPPCLPKSAVSYTYYDLNNFSDTNPKNSGLITVTAMEGYSDQLCKPFWVVVASWNFDELDDVWPQTLRETDPAGDHEEGYIDSVGTYYYYAAVDCGQGDVYASFTNMPYIGTELFGPNNPFAEKFLHSMGFTGPKPTYLVTSPGCNEAEPNEPTATPILECGTYGSINLTDVENPYVGYTVYSGEAAADGSVDGLTMVNVEDAREGTFTVVATAMNGHVFAPETTSWWIFDLGEYVDCPVEVAPVPVFTLANCFDRVNSYELPAVAGVQWLVDDSAVDPDTYVVTGDDEVVITAEIDDSADGGPFVFADGATKSWTQDFVEVTDEDCVLPVTNAFLAFNDATCLEAQSLDIDNFAFDSELAKLESTDVDSDGNYTVVFTAIGDDTVFDQSPDVTLDGRVVSNAGKTLTFTGTLAAPNTELCTVIPVVDPFSFVDTCLLGGSYTLEFVEGITYYVTVNSGTPFAVVFGDGETSQTYPAAQGDTVSAVPVADPGYVLSADQPTPFDRTFTTYAEGECDLPVLANWPASVTATDEVCTPFGATSGSITVQFSTGSEANPNPVRYYTAYGTPQQLELTSESTTVPAGDYVVTAVATDPTDSINDSGNTAVFALTVGAADESDCDLPTLAYTGASNAVTGIGIGAVIIILAGLGFVLRRQLTA
jgi:hypothetical protein